MVTLNKLSGFFKAIYFVMCAQICFVSQTKIVCLKVENHTGLDTMLEVRLGYLEANKAWYLDR